MARKRPDTTQPIPFEPIAETAKRWREAGGMTPFKETPMPFELPKTKSLAKAMSYLDIAAQVLDFISKLTKTTTDDMALAALRAIRAAVRAAEFGFAGKVTPTEVRQQLSDLKKALSTNDTVAIERLKAKFGKS